MNFFYSNKQEVTIQKGGWEGSELFFFFPPLRWQNDFSDVQYYGAWRYTKFYHLNLLILRDNSVATLLWELKHRGHKMGRPKERRPAL